ncbi:PPE family protein [Mycobacterium sp. WUMAC-067]|uniref:PPE family protein n=1 Tax=unclassified Mycobacterium TaxID=2642494 RepID=UPI001D76E380|nr:MULTISPECIES: PPE family protein [unclassified Mycobacterium]MCA2241128.1 PPE family protein [Mycobacterium sp. WUMAC-067]MCA2313405.1 PPE family protein [Mycobacterium sp. WUMAC-025]
MLDFGALPPEIHSGRMYSGPGPSSMMAAAWAWNMLAAELDSAANDYDTIITQLVSEEWMGPASAQMAEAAKPYVTWMRTTAVQAEQAAISARAATGAYEAAFAATVPPPLIEANRTQLAQAVSTNVLGQNTPLIVQLEAQYAEMWAQDATAMYGYAGQAAPVTQVTPFTRPTETTNPAGEAMQAASVAQAAGTSAGAESTQAQLLSSVPPTLQALASPAANTAPPPITEVLEQNPVFDMWAEYASPAQNTLAMMYRVTGMSTHFLSLSKGLAPAAKAASEGAKAAAALPTVGASLRGLTGGGSAISASLASAAPVGGLSVPPTWSAATPAAPSGASSIPVSRFITTPDTSGPGNLLGGMPLAGVGGSSAGTGPRYGIRPTVMARPPFAG